MEVHSGPAGQPDWLYIILERVRAGLGAAGVLAALVEGITSTMALRGTFAALATPLVIGLSILAFGVASYIVDVPLLREQDVEK